MRIISGNYKGKRIIAPKNLPVRPTADMQKEALFNIIDNKYYFENLSVLDLFSGTGNISYEFASRNTPAIEAVDGHYACVQFITKISKELDFPIIPIKSDVFKFLERTTNQYDLIFADPPYDMTQEQFERIVTTVFERNLLTPSKGILIIEHSNKTNLKHMPKFTDARKYGGTVFSFFELN